MSALHPIIIQQARVRLMDESQQRIERCLGMLTEEEIWYRPHAVCNSVGNLVLHLCGNARQWILGGLCGQPNARERWREFDAKEGSATKAELSALLSTLMHDIDEALNGVTEDMLAATHPVQVYQETGVSILIHVIEHFSYHTGQIAYITKMLKGTQTGFYEGVNLEVPKPD